MKKQKILMLEDNQLDAELIKEELTEHKFDFTSELIETKKDFIAAIHESKPDIILSDYGLPNFTGFEALKIAKKLIPDIPFIIVTGSLSEEMAADSIKRGAWDYVLKENLLRLTPAIENALKLKEEKDKNRQAVEALQNSEEKFRTIIEQSSDALYIINLEGNIIEVNNTTCTSLGYTRDELLSMNVAKIDTSYSDGNIRRNVLQRLQKGETVSIESFLTRKDNTTYPVEINIGIIKLKEKPVMLGFARDITDRKKRENELKAKYEQLEIFNNITVDRELKINETRKEVNDLLKQLGKEEKYKVI